MKIRKTCQLDQSYENMQNLSVGTKLYKYAKPVISTKAMKICQTCHLEQSYENMQTSFVIWNKVMKICKTCQLDQSYENMPNLSVGPKL